ncbi:MAG: hypothetical protein P1V97_14430 [Planctomycetota bacterium]|nr:hypothetical protein [Planctomycetota bacterium]
MRYTHLALSAFLVLTACQSARSTSMLEEPEALSKEQKSSYYSLRSRVLGDRKSIPEGSLAEFKRTKVKDSQLARVMVRWNGFKEWNRLNDGFADTASEDALVRVVDASNESQGAVVAIHQIEWLTHRAFFQSLKNEILEITLYVPVDVEKALGRVIDLTLHQGQLKDGQRDGPWLTKNIVGAKLEQGQYKGGKKDGPWTVYWTNGNKRSIGAFLSGTADGAWVYYYSNGKVSKKGGFKDGQKSGPWVSFFQTGKAEQTISYNAGLKSGKTTRFWGNGMPREKGQYEKGQASGDWTYWHSNGKVQQKGPYVDGEKNGVWQQFSKEGALTEESVWQQGRLVRQK